MATLKLWRPVRWLSSFKNKTEKRVTNRSVNRANKQARRIRTSAPTATDEYETNNNVYLFIGAAFCLAAFYATAEYFLLPYVLQAIVYR